ncbi:hypothetical protein HK101_001795 [Irineochytrium annulatum]|nr:hypothetical protein HK101_001795 [Irineochytrium annulatum]
MAPQQRRGVLDEDGDRADVSAIPSLNDDVLLLILSWLDPTDLVDRTTLAACLRGSWDLLRLTVPILWSNQAVLVTAAGIRRKGALQDVGRGWRRAAASRRGLLGALVELGASASASPEGSSTAPRGSGRRWRIYLGAVRAVWIDAYDVHAPAEKVRRRTSAGGGEGAGGEARNSASGKEGLDHEQHTASRPPCVSAAMCLRWIGRVDELTVCMKGDMGDWQGWITKRWRSNNVPAALTIVDPEHASAASLVYANHKGVKRLSLVTIGDTGLCRILNSVQHELAAIKIVGWPKCDAGKVMESLRDYMRSRGGKLKVLDLTFENGMASVPDGLPVTSLRLKTSQRLREFDLSAVADTLQVLTVENTAHMLPSIPLAISQMCALRELNLEMVRGAAFNHSMLLSRLQGRATSSMRSLTLTGVFLLNRDLSLVQTVVARLPNLAELGFKGSAAEDLNFSPIVEALPRLEKLLIKIPRVNNCRSHLRFPRHLKALTLSGISLEVDLDATKSEGVPRMEHFEVTGAIVDDVGTAVDKDFMTLLSRKECAPRLCFREFISSFMEF